MAEIQKRHGNIVNTKPHHNVYGIQYEQADSPSDTYKPRIWVNPAKMRYLNGSHYHYANVESEQKDIELFKKNRLNLWTTSPFNHQGRNNTNT